MELIKVLNFLRSCREMDIDEAKHSVIAKVVASQPVIRDVVPAKSVIKEFNEGKVILHAGPPIRFENMPDPVRFLWAQHSLRDGLLQRKKKQERYFCIR